VIFTVGRTQRKLQADPLTTMQHNCDVSKSASSGHSCIGSNNVLGCTRKKIWLKVPMKLMKVFLFFGMIILVLLLSIS